ncbi:ankyrin repeat-containing domain protein [Xylaria venustula]|nr:ankyrin repeat-containing domain protein [Xylaria venustula]
MSSLSRLWRRRRSRIDSREVAASPNTSVVKPCRSTSPRKANTLTPSASTQAGGQVKTVITSSIATLDSSTASAASGTSLLPTCPSQPAPGVLPAPHVRPNQCEEKARNEPKLPAPYATTFELWEDALGYLNKSGKGEDIVPIEMLVGELNGDPCKRPDAKKLAIELQKEVEGRFKEQQPDGRATRTIEKFLPVLMKFAAVVDVAVNVDPFHAALPWAAVRFVLIGLAGYTELRSQLLATLTIVASLFVQCDRYQQLYFTPDPALRPREDAMESLKASIVQAYAQSQLFLSFNLQQQRNKTGHLAAVFKVGDVESYVNKLSKCGEKLLEAAEFCENCCNFSNRASVLELLEIAKASHRGIQDQIKIVLDRIDDKERTELLEWISPVQYGKHHKRVKEDRVLGTCEWLLQTKKFCEWDAANSSVVLWLQGSPGVGKTFLTSKVIDHSHGRLKNSPNQDGFAFFYCDRNDEERREPLHVLKSYVRQLSTTVEKPSYMRPQLLALCKSRMLEASELSFDDCAAQLLESINLYEKTTLVLDALDECKPDSRRKIIKTIEGILSKSERPVKVFISSRPDRDIRSSFLDKPNIEIQATHNEEDIRKFVNEEIVNHGGWEDMSVDLQENIVTVLLNNSQGMFQWVSLQINQLLSLETEEAILDRLGKLPPDLKTAYDEIYKRIEKRHGYDRALAENALRWVMCAQRPLRSQELLAALCLNPEKDPFGLSKIITESQLLHLCNNLLVIDSQRSVWRFSHLSVAEYFEESHWSRSNAHSYAGKVCLKLLIETYKDLDDLDKDILKKPNDRPRDDHSSGYHTLDLRHPFNIYAQDYWINHIQAQEGEAVDPTLTQLLKYFLGSPNQSSPLYRRWHRHITGQLTDWLANKDGIQRVSKTNIAPANVALFVMCRFSFYNALLDWWNDEDLGLSHICEEGYNLLELAVVARCQPICENLVKRSVAANLHLGDFLDRALIRAARINRLEIAKLLVSNGANVNVHISYGKGDDDYSNQITALSEAAGHGDLELVKFLVQSGADVNLEYDKQEHTALSAAGNNGHLDIVKFLVRAGADVNMCLNYSLGGSALAVSTREVQEFLVKEAGADVDLQLPGLCGSALTAQSSVEKAEFLVKVAGADANLQLQSGCYGSALAAAIQNYRTDLIMFLVKEAGADVNLQLKYGDYGSALGSAACCMTTDMVELLVNELGADVNLHIEHGDFGSALAMAVARGRVKVIEFLLDAGADINQQIRNGRCGSALALAAYCAEKEVATLLIKAGADVNLVLENGPFRTALQAAQAALEYRPVQLEWRRGDARIEKDRAEIAELLRLHGATDEVS